MSPDYHDENFASSENVVGIARQLNETHGSAEQDAASRFEGMTQNELLDHLVNLKVPAYETVRKFAADKLNWRVSVLDEEVKRQQEARPKASRVETELDLVALAGSAQEIIECEDILRLFDADWSCLIAGERPIGRLLFLAGTSRVLDEPMHIAVKGSSSGGKSQVRKTALRFFPPESVISFTSLSEKALIYEERDFQHKILSMGEALATDAQEFQDMLLRELMSEHRLEHKTVVKNGDQPVTVTILKNGPVAFMVTTTKLKLHPENETRMLSLDVDESDAQTKRVLLKRAEHEEDGSAVVGQVNFEPWHNYQRWLELGDCRVSVPYARVLAEAIPPKSVRLRRDFGQVLTAIKAHALLHRHHRHREHSAVVADIEHDYAAVRELMHDLLREVSEVGVKETVMDTVAAVEKLTKSLGADEGVTAVAVGKALKMDKSAARRRLGDAVMAGLVVNLEARKNRPGKYRLTGESVQVEDMLPTPERLAELFQPGDPLPPVPHCNAKEKTDKNQQPSGGTDGGIGIDHRSELQAVARSSTTVFATAETLSKPSKTGVRWRGGADGNWREEGKEAGPDSRSARLTVRPKADPYDIPLPSAFDRRQLTERRKQTKTSRINPMAGPSGADLNAAREDA